MNYIWTKEEIFTGDVIETVADYIFDISNFVTGDHGRIKINYPQEVLVKKQIDEINNIKPDIIFVYGHDIDIFLQQLNNINHSFKLITHNSDLGVYEKHLPFLDSNKIIKWYAQNTYITHKKLIALPIGIARSKYPHGNLDIFCKITSNTEKNNLVYKNFDINTNYNERSEISRITENNGIFMQQTTNCESYWNLISKSIFTISPPGNGIDCHRIWESLYLKTIPVVKFHKALEQFKVCPICFIENWEEVTIDFLKSKVHLLEQFNSKLYTLSFDYWKKIIYTLQ